MEDHDDSVYIGDSGPKGKGLFAARDFRVGERVYAYPQGRLVKKTDVPTLSESDTDHLDLVDEEVYELMESPARYVNHSCDPNIIEEKGKRIGYALKPVKKGDELTVDYRIRAHDDWRLRCLCGSQNCTGEVVGNFFSMPDTLQKKYLPYAPTFIQEKYEEKHAAS